MPESNNREGRLDRSGDRMARLERGVGRLETGILVLAVVVVGTFLLNLMQRTPDEPDPGAVHPRLHQDQRDTQDRG